MIKWDSFLGCRAGSTFTNQSMWYITLIKEKIRTIWSCQLVQKKRLTKLSILSFFFFNFFFNVYLFLGQRETEHERGAGQRERETQNRKQAPGSEPSAQNLTRGSNSQTARSWPGWSRTLNRLRHPGAPRGFLLRKGAEFCQRPFLHRLTGSYGSYLFFY